MITESGEVLRQPLMGEVVPPEVWQEFSGLEVLQLIIARKLPRPPVSYLTGLRLVEASAGRAGFVLPASGWLANPAGPVEGGFIALLADAALQSAIVTTAPAGCVVASVDLKVNFLRPCFTDGQELVARGAVLHRGRSLVIASAEVFNAEGKRVALANGSALLLEGRSTLLEGAPEWEPADPGELGDEEPSPD